MKNRYFMTVALLLALAGMRAGAQNAGGAPSEQSRAQRLSEYVYFFASDSLRGRAAGSADAATARDFIVERYKECGLKPFSGGSYLLPFKHGDKQYTNVVAIIEGTTLKDEYIVLGAHYDHLGVKGDNIYPGADDNASGSAALIEIARVLSQERESLQRSVVVAAFDAEELGLYGSNYLAEYLDALVGLDKVKLMMSVDMVGWYAHNKYLKLEGVATIKDGKVLAKKNAEKFDLNIRPKSFETSVLTATDTQGFAQKQVPTLAVTTGLGPHYHKPTDTPDRIDYDGLDRISGYLADFALDAASDPAFAASGKVARKHREYAPVVEFGVTASVGSANLSFPKSSFGMDSGKDYTAGVMTRFNFGRVGMQLEALYDMAESRFPDTEQTFATGQNYSQRAVTVPLYFQLRTGGTDSHAFFGFGGYYSYVLSHSYSRSEVWAPMPHQGGLATNFGFQMGHLLLSWDFRIPLSEQFNGPQSSRMGASTYIKAAWLF